MSVGELTGVCTKHPFERADHVCCGCGLEYCTEDVVYPFGTKKPPYCVSCAIRAGGVRSSSGGSSMTRREVRRRMRAMKKRRRSNGRSHGDDLQPIDEPAFLGEGRDDAAEDRHDDVALDDGFSGIIFDEPVDDEPAAEDPAAEVGFDAGAGDVGSVPDDMLGELDEDPIDALLAQLGDLDSSRRDNARLGLDAVYTDMTPASSPRPPAVDQAPLGLSALGGQDRPLPPPPPTLEPLPPPTLPHVPTAPTPAPNRSDPSAETETGLTPMVIPRAQPNPAPLPADHSAGIELMRLRRAEGDPPAPSSSAQSFDDFWGDLPFDDEP